MKNENKCVRISRNNCEETGYKKENDLFIRHSFNDNPAVVNKDNGDELWFKHGLLHRDDGKPSFINTEDETKKKYHVEGVYHRKEGPAMTIFNTKRWYIDGSLHNDNGPAIQSYGETRYFIEGVMVTKQIVECPESQTIEEILSEENLEVKRIRIERFGWEQFVIQSECNIICKGSNDIEQTEEAIIEIGDQKFFLGACPSTCRIFAMEIPTHINNTEKARGYLSDKDPKKCILAT